MCLFSADYRTFCCRRIYLALLVELRKQRQAQREGEEREAREEEEERRRTILLEEEIKKRLEMEQENKSEFFFLLKMFLSSCCFTHTSSFHAFCLLLSVFVYLSLVFYLCITQEMIRNIGSINIDNKNRTGL